MGAATEGVLPESGGDVWVLGMGGRSGRCWVLSDMRSPMGPGLSVRTFYGCISSCCSA